MEAGANRRGSTGLGIGEVALDDAIDPSLGLTVSDCREPQILARKICRIADLKISQAEEIVARTPSGTLRRFLQALKAEPLPPDDVSSLTTLFRDLVSVVESRDFLTDAFRNGQSVLCEGAHGTLIDRDCGFPPYVTRRRTTAGTVRAMLDGLDVHPRVLTVGILRAIAFRHGPGPFVTEDDAAFAHIEERHNKANHWQGDPRHGWFDAVTARYAVACNRKVDVIAVTMLDQLALLPALYVSTGYLMPSRLADEGGAYRNGAPRMPRWMCAAYGRSVPRVHVSPPSAGKCRPLLALLARRDTARRSGPSFRSAHPRLSRLRGVAEGAGSTAGHPVLRSATRRQDGDGRVLEAVLIKLHAQDERKALFARRPGAPLVAAALDLQSFGLLNEALGPRLSHLVLDLVSGALATCLEAASTRRQSCLWTTSLGDEHYLFSAPDRGKAEEALGEIDAAIRHVIETLRESFAPVRVMMCGSPQVHCLPPDMHDVLGQCGILAASVSSDAIFDALACLPAGRDVHTHARFLDRALGAALSVVPHDPAARRGWTMAPLLGIDGLWDGHGPQHAVRRRSLISSCRSSPTMELLRSPHAARMRRDMRLMRPPSGVRSTPARARGREPSRRFDRWRRTLAAMSSVSAAGSSFWSLTWWLRGNRTTNRDRFVEGADRPHHPGFADRFSRITIGRSRTGLRGVIGGLPIGWFRGVSDEACC